MINFLTEISNFDIIKNWQSSVYVFKRAYIINISKKIEEISIKELVKTPGESK
jgi:hypothetical protein